MVVVFIKDGELCVQKWTKEEIEKIKQEAEKLKELWDKVSE